MSQAVQAAKVEPRCALKANSMRLDAQDQLHCTKTKYGQLQSWSQTRRRPTKLQAWRLMPLILRWYLPVVNGKQ